MLELEAEQFSPLFLFPSHETSFLPTHLIFVVSQNVLVSKN